MGPWLVLIGWAGLHLWVAHRLTTHGSERSPRVRRMIVVAVASLALVPVLAMLSLRAGWSTQLAGPVGWIGFSMMGLSSLLIALTLIVEIPRLVARASLALRRRLRARRGPAPADPGPAELISPERRRFFADVANYGIVGGAAGLSAYGLSEVLRVPRVEAVEVPVAGLHRDLDGLRIVQLSDVHVGPTIRGSWLSRVVEQVNALEPDLVALTGDFVDGFVEDLAPELSALAGLQARHGAFFVTGNHEYYWDGPAWCQAIAELGPRVLVNEHVVIERGDARLLVAGVADLSAERHVPAHRCDPARAKAEAPAHDFSLLLAHQPRSIYAAAQAGFDLQLSGHTHAGQYFPMSLMIHLFQPYVAGLAQHGATQIYVNRGTGYWGPPNRAGSPAEISLLTLRAS